MAGDILYYVYTRVNSYLLPWQKKTKNRKLYRPCLHQILKIVPSIFIVAIDKNSNLLFAVRVQQETSTLECKYSFRQVNLSQTIVTT